MAKKKKLSSKELEVLKKTCLGKIKHKSQLAADYYFDNIPHRDKKTLNVYKCPFCKFFHLGHNKDLDPFFQLKKQNENKLRIGDELAKTA